MSIYVPPLINSFLITIVVSPIVYSDMCRVSDLRRVERGRVKKSHFVLSSWVTDSIESREMRSERHYEPKIV